MRLLMWLVSLPGEPYVLPVFVLGTILWLSFGKQSLKGVWFGVANATAFLLTQIIKNATSVSRPLGAYEMGYSFPSGHVVQYVVAFGLLYHWKIARPLCVLMVSLVGISRIYLGAHWISDVVMGYVFGFGLLRVMVRIEKKWLFPRSASRK